MTSELHGAWSSRPDSVKAAMMILNRADEDAAGSAEEVSDLRVFHGNALIRYVEDLERRLSKAQPVKLWECPECCFSFDARHTDPDGSYSCPVCANGKDAAYAQQLRELLTEAKWHLIGKPMCNAESLLNAIYAALAKNPEGALAQPGRAPACHAEGQGIEAPTPRHPSDDAVTGHLREAAQAALEKLRAYIQMDGGCDHSVGICMCEEIRVADNLHAALHSSSTNTER